MADLKFDVVSDGKQILSLIDDVSNLKVHFKDLDSITTGLNATLRGSGNGIHALENAVAATRVHVQGLHKDLQDILGDISNVQLKGGLLGDISGVKVGGGLGKDAGPLFGQIPNKEWATWAGAAEQEARRATAAFENLEAVQRRAAASAKIPAFTGRNTQFAQDDNAVHGGGWGSLLEGLGGDPQAVERAAQAQYRLGDAIHHTTDAKRQGATAGRKATLALVEFSRGAEDAAVTFGTGGLGGALRASINNFSQMAFIIHPMAGVVAGLAGALTAALIPALLSTKKEAKDTEKALRDLMFTASDWRRANIAGRVRGPEFRGFDAGLGANERQFGGAAAGALTNATGQQRQFEDQLRDIEFNRRNRQDQLRLLTEEAEGRAGFASKRTEEWTAASRDMLTKADIQDFISTVQRRAGAGEVTGQGALEEFKMQRERAGRHALLPEAEKMLAETLRDVQKIYSDAAIEQEKEIDIRKALREATEEAARKQEELNRVVAEQIEFQRRVTQSELEDKADEQRARDRQRRQGLLTGMADELDPEARHRRELRDQIETIRATMPPGLARGFLADRADDLYDISAKERRDKEEFDRREEELQKKASEQSLEGKLTGLEELNRRITEAAGGGRKKDEAAEELKKLREERKQAEKEAKEARAKQLELLQAQLTELEKKMIGVAG